MTNSVKDIRAQLNHRLIPALPVPFTNARNIHHDSLVRMADYMSDMPIGGVAVWAHTGRGLYLSEAEREEVLTHWRDAMPDTVVIAGAGCPAPAGGSPAASDDAYIAGALDMAQHAASLGAHALLAYAPSRFRDRYERERDQAIVAYHREIASVGLPLILFYLYEAAGGIAYSQPVLRELLSIPNVIGIKLATLDSVTTVQDLTTWIKSEYPDKLVITGEDRFLGYSLMLGADAALIGMGCALPILQADLLKAHYTQDAERFLFLNQHVDRFAMETFSQPVEGYISRMLYALSWLGVVSREAVYDPWGPQLDEREIDAVGDFLAALPTELKR